MKIKKVWVWLGVAAIALVVFFAFSYKHSPAPAVSSIPVYAPQGQLVAGFPQNLVLDASAQVMGSYSVNYSTTTNQYSAEWTSSKSLNDLFTAYENYFKANGWTITNEMTKYAGTKGLHAETAAGSAGVSIVDSNINRKITVTYVAN